MCALYTVANDKKSLSGLYRFFCEDGQYHNKGLIFSLQTLTNLDDLQYSHLEEGISLAFGLHLPLKKLLPYLKEEPFISEDKKITDMVPSQESISLASVNTLIKVAISNNESFFNVFSICKTDTGYLIKKAQPSCPQAYSDNEDVLRFIANNCKDSFTILPKEFSCYADNTGILHHEDFYRQILKAVSSNIDTLKEQLIDIVKYDAVKVDFLKRLSSISLDLDKLPSDNAFSIKVFKMAVKVLNSDENRKFFRGLVSFVKNGVSTPLNNIPTSASSVFRCSGAKKDFDLAMLLPKEYGNGSLLKDAVALLQKEGISRQDIDTLLGISESPDQDEIYVKMKEHYSAFENTQQLAFAILKDGNGGINNSGMKAYDKSGNTNSGAFVVTNHSFIMASYNLDSRYNDLGDYISLPTASDYFIQDCYINNGTFVCGSLETTGVNGVRDYDKTIDLLEYLYTLHQTNKESFKEVNWSALKNALGFDAGTSAFPSDYAAENEKLPAKIESWAKQKEGVLEFFADMGLLINGKTEMRFRKHMIGESIQYTDTDIYSCQVVKRLEDSIMWLTEKSIFPVSEDKMGSILNAIEQINKLREKAGRGKIIVTDSFDFDAIKKSSIEYDGNNYSAWKEETGIKLFLFSGPLPKTITFDEYVPGIAVMYISDANIADCKESKTIYINRHSEPKTELHVLAKHNSIGLTNEMVYKLFDFEREDLLAKLEKVEKENRELKAALGPARMDARNSNDLDKTSQIDSNEEARKIVVETMKGKGFSFTNGIGQYSTIKGVVDPDGKPITVVVKSALAGDFFIHPNEWAELFTPGAQLWLRTQSGVYPIHLREMIRQQDLINLKIDTVNMDKENGITKIATLMRWMTAIHFNFKSIVPTHISDDYHEYAFDDRPMDEQPTADVFIP